LKIFEYDLIIDGIVVGQRTSVEGKGPHQWVTGILILARRNRFGTENVGQ
jgi:hypothetical protein